MRFMVGHEQAGFLVAEDLSRPVAVAMLCSTEAQATRLADEYEELYGKRPTVASVVVSVRRADEADAR